MTHASHGPLLQSFYGSDVTPRQNILGHHRDLFLYEHAKMLLHEKLREEGILSPYAKPVHLQTETATENANDKSETEMLDEQNEEILKDTQEWHAATKGFKHKDGKTQAPASTRIHHNMPDTLQEDTTYEYKNEDKTQMKDALPVNQTHSQQKKNKHAVDDIEVNRMDQIINEHKTNDKKLKEERKEFKRKVDIAKRQEESGHCTIDQMKLSMQCSTILHRLTEQEAHDHRIEKEGEINEYRIELEDLILGYNRVTQELDRRSVECEKLKMENARLKVDNRNITVHKNGRKPMQPMPRYKHKRQG